MDRTFHPRDPRSVDHPRLRKLALAAATVAKLEETEMELISLTAVTHEHADNFFIVEEWDVLLQGGHGIITVRNLELEEEADWWKSDPLMVAQDLARSRKWDHEDSLDSEVAAWLAEDDANWPLFHSVVFDAWQQEPGVSREDTPRWVAVLGGLSTVRAYGAVPYAPRPWVAQNQIVNNYRSATD